MHPLSIPSPPHDWETLPPIPIGSWLHAIIPAVPQDWSLVIHAYAVIIIVGIIVAVLIANHRLTKRGGEPWVIVDIGLWAVVLGIIFARAWHVVTHPQDYFQWTGDFGHDFYNIIAIWDGGNAIFGSLLGGALGVWIGCRITGLRFWSVADAIAPALLVAQAIGRVGNYFNQELFGLPTDAPWGLQIDRPNPAIPDGLPSDTLFQPTFLYELVWNLVGFVIILFIENQVRRVKGEGLQFTRRVQWQWGKVLGLYLVWYGIGRFWFESIRLDPSETFLGIRSNAWAALGAIVLGVIIIIVQSVRHPGAEPSVYRPGKGWTPETGVDSEDTYSETDDDGDDAESVTEAAATSGSASHS